MWWIIAAHPTTEFGDDGFYTRILFPSTVNENSFSL